MDKSLEKIAVAATLLLPLSMFVGSAASDILLSLIGVLYLVHSVLTRDSSGFNQPWMRVALLLWGYLLVRSGFTAVPADAFGRALPWIRFPCAALALQTWTLNTPERRQRFVYMIVFAVVYAVLDTALQYATGFDIFHHPTWGDARLTGPLRWPTDGITLHWLGVPLMAAAVHRMAQPDTIWRWRMLLMAGILLLLATIVMTGDRAAFLLSLLAGGGVLLCYPHTWKAMVGVGVCAAVLVAGLLYAQPHQLTRQLSSVEDVQHFAHSPYGNVWRGGIAVFKHAPVFGVGLKHYRRVCKTYETRNPQTGALEGCNIHPHNLYLEWLAESGLVGLSLFLAMAGCWLRQLWQRRAHWLLEPSAVGAVVIVLIRLLPIIPSASFFVAWAAVPLWLMLGWGLAI